MNPKAGGQDRIVNKRNIRWQLVFTDAATLIPLAAAMLFFISGCRSFPVLAAAAAEIFAFLLAFRLSFRCYSQIWRYGGIQSYIRELAADLCATAAVFAACVILPRITDFDAGFTPAEATVCTAICSFFSLSIRMIYRYAYKRGGRPGPAGAFSRALLRVFAGKGVYSEVGKISVDYDRLHKIAIIGAGPTGVALAEELMTTSRPQSVPVLIAAESDEQTGREIYGIPVVSLESATPEALRKIDVYEVVFCIPGAGAEERMSLFNYYRGAGIAVKVFDVPHLGVEYEDGQKKKRYIRDFEIDELLFRKPVTCLDESTDGFYRGKTVLITGGGGSIGSELCRQLARFAPKKIIILDVYENCAYDLLTELQGKYGSSLDVAVEILSVCDKAALDRVFATYRPDIVFHAAAHKHVPLMEHNPAEAVLNNVFGTLNAVDCAEKYGVSLFLMVSTDKAVNPTNVMGATKRVCEMIVMSRAARGGKTRFCATRFGNVLGSAGSVIPLFRRQIAAGGPVTITDKRIIRYFMTIPEASHLVLRCGQMAKNGELFVLDMGKPVKILELAENLIRLSGFIPYVDIDIVETGLRPGEKLYEELLISGENLSVTDDRRIFVERDSPLSKEKLDESLALLRRAAESGNDEEVRAALRAAVPTYRRPEQVNG